jgi:hypothetical protein
MELNKEYTSKSGVIRIPLFYSECKRFVFTECRYENKTLNKWFWSNHRIFN